MVTIWHNPRCSKSRQTLALLRERGIETEIIDYLKTPPGANAISDVLGKLGIGPRELIRKGESVYRELGLKDADDATLLEAMAGHPILIERPVVIVGGKAAICRPPEAVLDIL
jgi:arsenate reductase